MSVTRYNFDGIPDPCAVIGIPRTDGEYIKYVHYAALLARHNELKEAVRKEHLAFNALDDAGFQLGAVGMPIWTDHAAARAEVDRLLEEKH